MSTEIASCWANPVAASPPPSPASARARAAAFSRTNGSSSATRAGTRNGSSTPRCPACSGGSEVMGGRNRPLLPGSGIGPPTSDTRDEYSSGSRVMALMSPKRVTSHEPPKRSLCATGHSCCIRAHRWCGQLRSSAEKMS